MKITAAYTTHTARRLRSTWERQKSTCKGDSDAYELAIWQQGGYSYSISLQSGIRLEELQAMIETVED